MSCPLPEPVPPRSSRGLGTRDVASSSSWPSRPPTQSNLPVAGIDAEDLDLDLVADLDHLLGALDLVVGQLRDVQEALQAGLQLDEDAELGELGHLALLHLPRLVPPRDIPVPQIARHLLS